MLDVGFQMLKMHSFHVSREIVECVIVVIMDNREWPWHFGNKWHSDLYVHFSEQYVK
jgi:hypothetical protein